MAIKGLNLNLCLRIGFAIAKKLAEDGADVVISSRKQKNVDKAVNALKALNLSVTGLVCHVRKPEDRQRLLKKVSWSTNQIYKCNMLVKFMDCLFYLLLLCKSTFIF